MLTTIKQCTNIIMYWIVFPYKTKRLNYLAILSLIVLSFFNAGQDNGDLFLSDEWLSVIILQQQGLTSILSIVQTGAFSACSTSNLNSDPGTNQESEIALSPFYLSPALLSGRFCQLHQISLVDLQCDVQTVLTYGIVNWM